MKARLPSGLLIALTLAIAAMAPRHAQAACWQCYPTGLQYPDLTGKCVACGGTATADLERVLSTDQGTWIKELVRYFPRRILPLERLGTAALALIPE